MSAPSYDEIRSDVAKSLARVAATDDTAKSPSAALVKMVRALGDAHVLRYVAQENDGGAYRKISSVALIEIRERLAYQSGLLDLAFAMQGLSSYAISTRGSEQLRRTWLPGVITGEHVGAFALTEPGAGSDVNAISTHATQTASGYTLNGVKTFISNAPVADFFTVFARTRPIGEPKGLTAFVVPKTAVGLRIEAFQVLGDHPIGTVHFENVAINESTRIGEDGEGMSLALATLHRFRPTVGAAAVGFATRAFDETRRHVQNRRQFGAPLAKLEAVQLALANMHCELEGARALVTQAAMAADADLPRETVGLKGSTAKLVATEAAQRIIDSAVQLHGGLGVRKDSIVAALYEEIRALRIYEGASDVQRLLIARELLRTP